MSVLTKRRVLIVGILSPLAALVLYTVVYNTSTQLSSNHEKDWLFRLTLSGIAMTGPFFYTLALAIQEGRRQPLEVTSKVGLGVALLSLALVAIPANDGIRRSKQMRNLAMHDVMAPPFDTPDISGNSQRLADHRGEVVLVNIWATWCEPCRAEMPKLDQLYRERKDKGFVVFGLSDESVDVQRKFLQQIPVSYPLLTLSEQVPSLYRDIARYPALFLIDRQGRLQPAPDPGQPFGKVAEAVDSLLAQGSP